MNFNLKTARPAWLLMLGMGLALSPAMAQTEIPLWPALKDKGQETIVERGTPEKPNRSIRGAVNPSLALYLPAQNPTGAAVILCPGGGYSSLAIDLHGGEIARWLQARGVAGLVLKYRLPHGAATMQTEPLPFQDARRALQLARENAAQWNLRPNRIGMMGFSAGGHLVANAATLFEAEQKPNFLILISPVLSMRDQMTSAGTRTSLLGADPAPRLIERYSAELHASPQTPPTFIVHAQNDKTAPPAASSLFFAELQKNNVPATLFSPRDGGHGIQLGIGGEAAQWPQHLESWLRERALMAAPRAKPLTQNGSVPDVARPLPLSAVRLTGGPLERDQDVDAASLLSLEPEHDGLFPAARRSEAQIDKNFWVDGDAAPNARFNYRYENTAQTP